MAWKAFIALLVFAVFTISACGTSGDPVRIVENYIAAIVAADGTRAINISCATWEEQARTDADSFLNVEATIEGLVCSVAQEKEGESVVGCSGQIVANYQGENKEIDLSLRLYRVAVEGGEWRVCGYQ